MSAESLSLSRAPSVHESPAKPEENLPDARSWEEMASGDKEVSEGTPEVSADTYGEPASAPSVPVELDSEKQEKSQDDEKTNVAANAVSASSPAKQRRNSR